VTTGFLVKIMDNDKVELSEMRCKQRVTKSGWGSARNSWAYYSHIVEVLARGQLV
jgi:hypothetical protein